MSAIHFSHVSFSYSSAIPIVQDVSFDLGPGWTGLVGANGVGKSTLLSLIHGELSPDSGAVLVLPAGLSPVRCEQRVDELTADIDDLSSSWERDAVRMRATLALDTADLDRWPTLSPGERRRWQIGSALVRKPDVLLLDEPTNHLDMEARDLLVAALEGFDGCGIVVSHDRTLLNQLTDRTIRMIGGTLDLWNAPYDTAKEEWLAAARYLDTRRDTKVAERRKLERRLADQRRKSTKKDADRIRERRAAGKHDLDTRGSAASAKHERGQRTGAQTVASMSNALDRVASDINTMVHVKDHGGTVDFAFERSNKERLLRYDGPVSAGDLPLFSVDLAVARTDRIRIAGPNGAGKTSLMACLLDRLAIPSDKVLILPQETSASDAVAWLDTVRRLPPADLGRVMSVVALLGADPAAVLASEQPSPGETRKLALALGLGTPKWLLALDEPTNHLDLPSLERLETALTSYRGALMLITHDDRLAAATTDTTWFCEDFGVDSGSMVPGSTPKA